MLDINCVVGVSMTRAPPLARSGEARYWGQGGGGGGGRRNQKKRKLKRRRKKEENVLSRKGYIKSGCCNGPRVL